MTIPKVPPKPVVCVDLDGTLAKANEKFDLKVIGDPFPGAVQFMRKLIDAGYEVVVYSCRLTPFDSPDWSKSEAYGRICNWLYKHSIPYSRIFTGENKPFANVYVDDRAVTCRPEFTSAAAFTVALEQVHERIAEDYNE